ncbi:hypothetical protein [Thermoanaerobacterium sp. DL9XJH110]|uniref:hypothetical protein n=1 Tax=Thermoanaerobacterium sp. DL9XJH110 TaxID=3386643 RepID=UPI003BB707D7
MAKEKELRSVLTAFNYLLGIAITVFSVEFFLKKGAVAPLYITAAIIIAGPLEDFLVSVVKPEQRWLVDQLTSVGFMIFLLLAVLESAKK